MRRWFGYYTQQTDQQNMSQPSTSQNTPGQNSSQRSTPVKRQSLHQNSYSSQNKAYAAHRASQQTIGRSETPQESRSRRASYRQQQSHDNSVSEDWTAHQPFFSHNSSRGIPDSAWYASDFLLGAGTVIIQPSTGKVVLVYEQTKKYWFLPKGRKDIGESLEKAALREAYEESGYRAEFLPVYIPTKQPSPPGSRLSGTPNTEAFYVSTYCWRPRRNASRKSIDNGGEYITHWYIAQIPEDAVREEGTGMPDEVDYVSHLLTINQAMEYLEDCQLEAFIVRKAWDIWQSSVKMERQLREKESKASFAVR